MTTQKKTLLVVDDDDNNRDLLSIILRSEGHQVLIANDGRDALDILEGEPVDLVLLDLMMPGVDGYEVLRTMRTDLNLRQIPVIVVTAVGKKDSVNRCLAMGARDYVVKPFDVDTINKRLAEVLASEHKETARMDQVAVREMQWQRKQKQRPEQHSEEATLVESEALEEISEKLSRLQQLTLYQEQKQHAAQAEIDNMKVQLENLTQMQKLQQAATDLLAQAIPAGLELLYEADLSELMDRSLSGAMNLANADGGILYLLHEDRLECAALHNTAIDYRQGGASGEAVTYPPLSLLAPEVDPPKPVLAPVQAAKTKKQINISNDAQSASGHLMKTRIFDTYEYKTTAFLITPLILLSGQVIGVLELVNPRRPENAGAIVPFNKTQEASVDFFCRLAAVAINLRQKGVSG